VRWGMRIGTRQSYAMPAVVGQVPCEVSCWTPFGSSRQLMLRKTVVARVHADKRTRGWQEARTGGAEDRGQEQQEGEQEGDRGRVTHLLDRARAPRDLQHAGCLCLCKRLVHQNSLGHRDAVERLREARGGVEAS
jgi:hypothetical protein